MDVVVKNLNVAVRAGDVDTDRHVGCTASRVVSYLEAPQDEVALVLDVDQASLPVYRETGAVNNRGLPRIALERDVAGSRIS